MSFFVTSVGLGDGGNLGGLAGADAHCQKLAAAVGAGNKTWHAYLSTQAEGNQPGVNARDRIGTGPWFNYKGVTIAKDLGDLHGDTLDQARIGNNITKQSALTEKGDQVNGPDENPAMHDMLTGSKPDGTTFTDSADHTCHNWTSNSVGAAMHGHSDRNGSGNTSWNATRPTESCTKEDFARRGGFSMFYCFAIN
jgi:hypothetical protein